MNDIKDLWLKFNKHSNNLSDALGRTSNLVGEYAENLAYQYYGGSLHKPSSSGADIIGANGKLYQVKARKATGATQLGVIRSWEFDFLVVILLSKDGTVSLALEVPVAVAKEYGVKNEHQNGWVITTSQKFLGDKRSKKITGPLSQL